MKTTFEGEVQFSNYTDSSRGGPRIALRLHDRDDLRRFVGMEGKRFACVLVEIADDETPAGPTPTPAPKASTPAAKRERMAPLCEWAVLRCDEREFQDWAMRCMTRRLGGAGVLAILKQHRSEAAARSALARRFVCDECGIESRKELDTNPEAAKRFHERVRAPYAAWLQRQGVTA